MVKTSKVGKNFLRFFYIVPCSNNIHCGLKTLMRKLEHIGDHSSNFVEEIVFYVDAKVLKHAGKKKIEKLCQ